MTAVGLVRGWILRGVFLWETVTDENTVTIIWCCDTK